VALLLPASLGGLYGGYALAHEIHHWIAWAVALIIVEPIGLGCLLALGALFSPDSLAAHIFNSHLRRLQMSTLILGIVWVGPILVMFLYAMIGWLCF
jgi:hypothetical protein